MDENQVIVQRCIMTYDVYGNFNKYVSLDVLREFIEKHGVDYRDKNNDHVLLHCLWMPLSHIDLVLSYNPKFISADGVEYFGYYSYEIVYTMEKILERDKDFLYVTEPVDFFFMGMKRRSGPETYLEHVKYMMSIDKHRDDTKYGKQIILMLENHEKRYYRLFDLLLQVVEKDNNNKKPRVY